MVIPTGLGGTLSDKSAGEFADQQIRDLRGRDSGIFVVQRICPEARFASSHAVSARPFVPGSTLGFAVPMKKFAALTP